MRSKLRPSDVRAALVGIGAAILVIYVAAGLIKALSWGECHGELTPYLGSGRQAHVTPFCLAKDEGPLIALKKRLGIYDPAWKIVIR